MKKTSEKVKKILKKDKPHILGSGFYVGMLVGTCKPSRGCGRRHTVDNMRMNEPQIAEMLSAELGRNISQGWVHSQLQKEAKAQNFVDRIRRKK